MKAKKFFVAGYNGEGAKRMLMDLKGMENVELIDKVIDNRAMRFLYYRCNELTDRFKKCHFLKNLFYPWFNLLRLSFDDRVENCLLFFNSGFCQELDMEVIERLRRKNKDLKLVLYIVDPMAGFSAPEHKEIIRRMDLVYAINREECRKYGFRYYPLVYSKDGKEAKGEEVQGEEGKDLYYLGSGVDRTEILAKIYQQCKKEGIKTDFHVQSEVFQPEREGIAFGREPISYAENIRLIRRANCILEVMHKDFDNPTQRYSEAVVYNKKLLTNNTKITAFDFYDPRYMKVFQSPEEIDAEFVLKKEEVSYGYQDEFSPRLLIQEITAALNEMAADMAG